MDIVAGQVIVIGGSKLFHGAPLLALKMASKLSRMVFFASPDENLKDIANQVKSKLFSFIWVPWDEVGAYINKSDACLIGPGFMRYHKEENPPDSADDCDVACNETKNITSMLLKGHNDKKWVIDAGSLQVIEPDWIPRGSIITPNMKEFENISNLLAIDNSKSINERVAETATKLHCSILYKDRVAVISDGENTTQFEIGDNGADKGGMGDVIAALTTCLFTGNSAHDSCLLASNITKDAVKTLNGRVGKAFNAEDLIDAIAVSHKDA